MVSEVEGKSQLGKVKKVSLKQTNINQSQQGRVIQDSVNKADLKTETKKEICKLL